MPIKVTVNSGNKVKLNKPREREQIPKTKLTIHERDWQRDSSCSLVVKSENKDKEGRFSNAVIAGDPLIAFDAIYKPQTAINTKKFIAENSWKSIKKLNQSETTRK